MKSFELATGMGFISRHPLSNPPSLTSSAKEEEEALHLLCECLTLCCNGLRGSLYLCPNPHNKASDADQKVIPKGANSWLLIQRAKKAFHGISFV